MEISNSNTKVGRRGGNGVRGWKKNRFWCERKYLRRWQAYSQ